MNDALMAIKQQLRANLHTNIDEIFEILTILILKWQLVKN